MKRKTLAILLALFLFTGVVGVFSDSGTSNNSEVPPAHFSVSEYPQGTSSDKGPATEIPTELPTDSEAPIKDEPAPFVPNNATTQPSEEKPGPQLPTGKTASFSIADVPSYSGSPYVQMNGNMPYFDTAVLSSQSVENYSALDELGRCGVVYACIGRDIMPTEERGSIGMVKPSGWHTVRYDDLIADKYLYNRCHLIGYQLTGENANLSNLITGTRYLNIEGMLPFENMTADYVERTGNHVAYRVTPIFEGTNLLATGVLMEACSVEDQGNGICFCIFAYNVQPGIEIDYATGDSREAEESSTMVAPVVIPNQTVTSPVENTPSATTTEEEPIAADYILNTNTKKFHYLSCSSVSDMKEKNKKEFTGSRDDVISMGYKPCGRCHP